MQKYYWPYRLSKFWHLQNSHENQEKIRYVIYFTNNLEHLAKSRKDKPVQAAGGAKIRFMVPGIIHEPLSKDPQNKLSKPGTITWICQPYFCLQKYSGSVSGLPPSSHPIRTLLQARFSLTRKERDMQQAACHLLGTPQDHCFHIAQIWCIIIDDGKRI